MIKNNICLGNGTDTPRFDREDSPLSSNNRITGILTALFTKPGTHNYTPKSSCAAIDAGTAKLCTPADHAAEKCHSVLVLPGFAGAHPDQGAAEVGTPTPALVAHYGFDIVATDGGPRGNHCAASAITYTSAAGHYVEGTHAAVFDAHTDHLTCPHVGLSDPTTFTIKGYAHATALSGKQYMWAHHTENPTGQRIYAYTDGTELRFHVGSQPSLPIMTLTTGRYYQIVMVVGRGSGGHMSMARSSPLALALRSHRSRGRCVSATGAARARRKGGRGTSTRCRS